MSDTRDDALHSCGSVGRSAVSGTTLAVIAIAIADGSRTATGGGS
ncbi:hypothetical protein [Streptosporangium sp. LJ11]